MTSKRILVGIILGAHGIKGDVRLKSLTDNPEDIKTYGELMTDTPQLLIKIQTLKPKADDVFLARLQGVTDRTAAEHLKGTKLYIESSQLKETASDEYYAADLVGLSVKDSQGNVIGTVLALYNFDAGDLVEIRLADKSTVMIPFNQESCPEINVAGGYITVNETVLEMFQNAKH
jgi:16S rRNA processing protein RimM